MMNPSYRHIGEVCDVCARMVEASEKRRRLRYEDVEITRRQLDNGATQRLAVPLRFDLSVERLAERRAERQFERDLAEERVEREFQLETRRLDLLGNCATLPANHLHATLVDDEKENEVTPQTASRYD